jgi:hypothetical protein
MTTDGKGKYTDDRGISVDVSDWNVISF